jgi:SAM-dependent methyltransferase
MDYLLPPTTYQPPPRPARMSVLNTIIEDLRESHFEHERTQSSDEETVVVIMDAKVQSPPVTARRIPLTEGLLSPSSESCSGTCESIEWRRRSDFDELYDATDDETEFESSCPSLTSSRPTSVFTDSTRNSHCSVSSRNRYPSILIPSSQSWHTTESPRKTSPIPPTPPPKIPVSPAALSLLPRSVPSINAPPSLDGSSMSEQASNLSAPVTPAIDLLVEGESWGLPVRVRLDVDSQMDVSSRPMTPEIDIRLEESEWGSVIENFPLIPSGIRADASPTIPPIDDSLAERSQTPSECGVLLGSDALDTLRHLNLDLSPEPSSAVDFNNNRLEMQEGFHAPSRPRSATGLTPASANSEYSFTNLSIPSPGGFFSSLGAGARHTWCPSSASAPPSSTTAEHFYNCPWNAPQGEVVEQILEVDPANTEGPPTARQIPEDPPTARRVPLESRQSFSTVDTVEEIKQAEVVYEYDETYESELNQLASANLDRTSIWLAAQASYLSALRETNPVNDLESSPEKRLSKHGRDNSLDSPVKKIVRFLEDAVVEPDDKKEVDFEKKDSTYYRGFQHVVNKTKRRDSFTHSSTRYDAVQTSRICRMDSHVDQLLGKFEPHEPKRPTYSGPFSQRPPSGVHELTPQQKVFDRVEREQAALEQMTPSMWAVEALKYLNGGKLVPSPGAKHLAKAAPLNTETTGKHRVRVLDLGGQPSCDWAWHCASEFRNVKTYTVITKQQVVNPALKGPRNHRQVSVPHLWELPFPDGHFDVISARSLHTALKAEKPIDMTMDEYDLCLRECLRCLKPSGYLEFMLMDSEIIHAGPRGSATSVEFGFNLKTRGYDPAPTKLWLGKLRNAGFVNMKRAWMFLPMGCETRARVSLRETPGIPRDTEDDLEAVQGPVGSTSDISNISGLLGSWMWEQWMLKLQLEMGRDREHLLEGVAALIEEGRNCNAGWRCLSGWARKPRGKKDE